MTSYAWIGARTSSVKNQIFFHFHSCNAITISYWWSDYLIKSSNLPLHLVNASVKDKIFLPWFSWQHSEMHRTEIMSKANKLHIERSFELYPRLQSTQSIQLHCELLPLAVLQDYFKLQEILILQTGIPFLIPQSVYPKAVPPIEP